MAKKFSKEPTVATLKSEIRKILDSYYPYNNFKVSVKTANDMLIINIDGCDFDEEFRNILNRFVDYKIKHIYRKKTVKEENKVVVKRIPYKDFYINMNDDCVMFSYYRYL